MKNIYTRGNQIKLDDTEEQICDLKDRVVEVTQTEQQKTNKKILYENSLKDLWDNTKHTNIYMVGVEER